MIQEDGYGPDLSSWEEKYNVPQVPHNAPSSADFPTYQPLTEAERGGGYNPGTKSASLDDMAANSIAKTKEKGLAFVPSASVPNSKRYETFYPGADTEEM